MRPNNAQDSSIRSFIERVSINEKPERRLFHSLRTGRLLSWMLLEDQPSIRFCRLSSSAWSYLSWIVTRPPTWWTVLCLFVRSGCPTPLHAKTYVTLAIYRAIKSLYATACVATATNRINKGGWLMHRFSRFTIILEKLGAHIVKLFPYLPQPRRIRNRRCNLYICLFVC